jgi:hypothetical protein
LEDPARKHFSRVMTDRERAVFEGAIAVATIYHQFLGMPITDDDELISALQDAMESSASKQPFRKEVKVRIRRKAIGARKGTYGYRELDGRMLDVRVVVEYGRASATVRMKYLKDLDYPLMYVERLKGP